MTNLFWMSIFLLIVDIFIFAFTISQAKRGGPAVQALDRIAGYVGIFIALLAGLLQTMFHHYHIVCGIRVVFAISVLPIFFYLLAIVRNKHL